MTRVPDAVAPPPRHPRFPLVDGMRALAALSVLTVHAATFGGGAGPSLAGRLLAHLNVGVTIFFLISGFLLYRPFVAHLSGGAPAPAAGDYLKRRVLRIYPAYWVALTVLVIVPGLTGVVDGNWWPMYALLHTWPLGHGTSCVGAPLSCGLAQTWSLVIEVTFYAALPVYALLVARATRGLALRARVGVELGLLAALSLLSLVLQFAVYDTPPWWLGDTALGYALWFALGMGMALVSVAAAGRRPARPAAWLGAHPGLVWAAAAALYLALSLWLPAGTFLLRRRDVLVEHVVFAVVAALLLAPAVYAGRAAGAVRHVLAHPVAAWLGLVSYGIFLWHYVVVLELGQPHAGAPFGVVWLGAVAITVPLAAASYYLVERPLLRLKYRRLIPSRDGARRVLRPRPGD